MFLYSLFQIGFLYCRKQLFGIRKKALLKMHLSLIMRIGRWIHSVGTYLKDGHSGPEQGIEILPVTIHFQPICISFTEFAAEQIHAQNTKEGKWKDK